MYTEQNSRGNHDVRQRNTGRCGGNKLTAVCGKKWTVERSVEDFRTSFKTPQTISIELYPRKPAMGRTASGHLVEQLLRCQ